MSIKAVLFDLDGTLLPMDQEAFIKAYFGGLVRRLAPYGYAPDEVIGGLWKGSAAMVQNTGKEFNETVFWRSFEQTVGRPVTPEEEATFEAYYKEDFPSVSKACGYDARAKEAIDLLKSHGKRLILATNPLFPAMATHERMRWANLALSDFELVTTFENSKRCKPNPDYYKDILSVTGLTPKECLMVGNDVEEDMIAQTLGMSVFLLTDCLINKKERDISSYPQGGFDELLAYLKTV